MNAVGARATRLCRRRQGVFIVWGPPSMGPRSSVLARELGLPAPRFLFSITRHGWLAAPVKYGYQALRTAWLLLRDRPPVVLVQSPPSWVIAFAALYGLATGRPFLVDAHSAHFQYPVWTRPRRLHAWLARRAAVTIVTNAALAERVVALGGRAMVVPDVPTTFRARPVERAADGPVVAVVNTFQPDEPLDAVLEAARSLPDVTFVVTGRPTAAAGPTIAAAPPNVRFTGFLANEDYYGTLASADVVACLTTRDETMQRGACEALSLERPILTSDWPVLRDYFDEGTVHVANTADGIRAGVERAVRDLPRLNGEVADLAARRRAEWVERRAELRRLARLDPEPAR
jgi:glycosyltransferase involved in cell wall biosynthesis